MAFEAYDRIWLRQIKMSALEASSDIQMTPFSTGTLLLSRGLSCQKRAGNHAFPTPYF